VLDGFRVSGVEGGTNGRYKVVHVYFNKFRKGGVVYRYLVVAEYDPATKRKRVLARIRDTDLLRLLIEAGVVRGVGFEPTQAYAIGSSARPL